jgi:HEAT repeat protein
VAAHLLTHTLSQVRAKAVRTLGLLGDTEHVEAAGRVVDDLDPEVRRQARRALERLRLRLDLIE